MERNTLEQFLKLEADDILRLPFVHEYGKKKKATVYPLTVGKYIEINPYLTQISKNNLKAIRDAADKNNFEEMPELFEKFGEPIGEIIRIVTGEDIKEMEFRDVYIILISILARMGTKSFQTSIICASAMSRNTNESYIACSVQFN
jgi:hypothetical protein